MLLFVSLAISTEHSPDPSEFVFPLSNGFHARLHKAVEHGYEGAANEEGKSKTPRSARTEDHSDYYAARCEAAYFRECMEAAEENC